MNTELVKVGEQYCKVVSYSIVGHAVHVFFESEVAEFWENPVTEVTLIGRGEETPRPCEVIPAQQEGLHYVQPRFGVSIPLTPENPIPGLADPAPLTD